MALIIIIHNIVHKSVSHEISQADDLVHLPSIPALQLVFARVFPNEPQKYDMHAHSHLLCGDSTSAGLTFLVPKTTVLFN